MRRHAKASTAGSTQRQAGRLGRIFRGALATRGPSSDSKGSSAPSARRFAIPLSAFAAILGALIFVVALAAAAAPKATTGSASNIEKTAARLNGTVNPEGVLLEECKFEYGTTESYGQTKACNLTPAEIGTGTSNVAVNADLTGLTIATTYHFRVVAKNSEGTVNGADKTFKTLSPPVIAAEWAENVVRTEATLKAQINPEGFATTYKLEWGPTASYGNSSAESNVGSDKANHTVSNFLTGLAPDTTYHYRFVAINSIGTTEGPDHSFTTYAPLAPETDCPNQAFRAGAAAQLPDCRAYEMVSPVDKANGDIEWFDETLTLAAALNQSSLDGEKITYSSYKAFGDAVSAPYTSQYIATRHAGEGWSTHAISPPARGGIIGGAPVLIDREFHGFSTDLSSGWLVAESHLPLAPGAIEGNYNLYKRNNSTDTYETVSIGNTGGIVSFEGLTPDGSHALFLSRSKLTPDAPVLGGAAPIAYEWVEGDLHLVAILPNGEPLAAESTAGSGQDDRRARNNRVQHAISDDGSRIFWTGGGDLYVRLNPDKEQSAVNGSNECTEPAKACTILIIESGGSNSPEFYSASPDGSRAIYVFGQLPPGGGSGNASLYEFDVDTETSTLIAGGIYGVAGVGEDTSYVYFVSKENLDSGATAGARNLYLAHNGATAFIATLSDRDASGINPTAVSSKVAYQNTRATPDGRHLTFMSNRSLTGYDNVDAGSGEAVSEVYRYDADSDQLDCVSCNPSGARPSGSESMPEGPFAHYNLNVAAWIPPWESVTHAARVLTDDGNRLFFNSFDALVPRDTNGAQDVYEWEAPGVGSCTEASPDFSERNGGCMILLSSGESPVFSEFIDADPDGKNAFFRTKSSLAPQDPGLIDLYDARAGGGLPAPPAPPTPCVGDACQTAPEAPNDPTPASASFRGAGDPSPRKARRRSCRARHLKGGQQAKSKQTKRCKRNNRRAGR